MKAWEIVGYAFDGEIYCPECSPCTGPDYKDGGDGATPIFAIDENACNDHCGVCGEPLLEG